MGILKTIKANIIYYYLAAVVYVFLIVAVWYLFPTDAIGYSSVNFYVVIPIICLILGFLAGGARSYAKWGFPIYIALLTLCLSIMTYDGEDWVLMGIGFAVSLAGVIIRHITNAKRRSKK